MTNTVRRSLMLLSFLALAACGGPAEDASLEPTANEASQEQAATIICPDFALSAPECANLPATSACVRSTGEPGTCHSYMSKPGIVCGCW
ncbi:hypothetical protein JY651_50370 [Pyxidicoccus parkwayensis]|uniref:Lipoprotein n=1 Tax=Pyxidicoccus parkwayensis TaxID=2813578 RepID=A0ABX7NXU2_9BACT|nr:hypothetical protein [Pyxidicoccus parkwaysis]QSQ23199.1 hypothetical protein JY651_50370 [Pyxidicoccus parkwaysis]